MKILVFILELLALLFTEQLEAQAANTCNISGRVIDENGEPTLFASVSTQPFTTDTITDTNGVFSFFIPVNCDTLRVKYTGYPDKIFTPLKELDSIVIIIPYNHPGPTVIKAYKPVIINLNKEVNSKSERLIRRAYKKRIIN
ncbi:MAG: carboxypeptidase-like regulatory domain-containing protein [Bacteroidota bacterium]|nr:carboxypeptidase-like regulatory domain-containing protein [Bacteroidota bacterium]